MNTLKTIEGIPKPTRATPGSVGHDIYAPISGTVPAKGSFRFDTGIIAETDSFLKAVDVRSRSGWAWNHDVIAFHGLIDHDYAPQTIGLKLFNLGNEDFSFEKNDRVAQLTFNEYIVDEQAAVINEGRTGGMGSTGA